MRTKSRPAPHPALPIGWFLRVVVLSLAGMALARLAQGQSVQKEGGAPAVDRTEARHESRARVGPEASVRESLAAWIGHCVAAAGVEAVFVVPCEPSRVPGGEAAAAFAIVPAGGAWVEWRRLLALWRFLELSGAGLVFTEIAAGSLAASSDRLDPEGAGLWQFFATLAVASANPDAASAATPVPSALAGLLRVLERSSAVPGPVAVETIALDARLVAPSRLDRANVEVRLLLLLSGRQEHAEEYLASLARALGRTEGRVRAIVAEPFAVRRDAWIVEVDVALRLDAPSPSRAATPR